MGLIAFNQVLAQSSELAVYILPIVGSVLLFYGIYQAVYESRASARRKVADRLRGERRKPDEKKIKATILRRGALGSSRSFADAIAGKFKFTQKLQTLLDQADVNWSAPQAMLNVSGGAMAVTLVLLLLQFSPIAAIGCGVALLIVPLLLLNLLP